MVPEHIRRPEVTAPRDFDEACHPEFFNREQSDEPPAVLTAR